MYFEFEVTKLADRRLQPQIATALEKHVELQSRQQLPMLWKTIDRLGRKKTNTQKNEKWTKRKSWFCLGMGVIAFVPGIANIKESWALMGCGLIGILVGAWGLFYREKPKNDAFTNAAEHLMVSSQRNLGNDAVVSFDDEKMVLTDKEQVEYEKVSYDEVECIIETADLFTVIFDDRVAVLQKNDLLDGDVEGLRGFLETRVRVVDCIDAEEE